MHVNAKQSLVNKMVKNIKLDTQTVRKKIPSPCELKENWKEEEEWLLFDDKNAMNMMKCVI